MNTIRRRLTQRLLFGWSLLLAAGSLIAWWMARNALTRQFDDALRTRAIALMSAIEENGGRIDLDTDDPLVHDFDAAGRAAFYEIGRPDGSVVARSPSLGQAKVPWAFSHSSGPEFANIRFANGSGFRAVTLKFHPQPADDAKKPDAAVEAILVVGADRHELNETLATLALVLGGSGLLVLALTSVTVPWLLRRELAPLNRLADQAERITADSLAERFPTRGLPGELAPIGARLNDLLRRLQTSFEHERQFSDDLAHEFRTPIAELRSLAELALKWPASRNPDTDHHVHAIALQLETIINRLLAVARGEQGRSLVEPQRVELADLISAVWEPLQPRAAARRLSVKANVPATLAVHSDPVLLRCIVTNLLDNAVEYSAPGSAVEIRGEAREGRFTLSVTNGVQHFSADDASHLFERFWRKDSARSGGNHAGLGLPLARAFATSLRCSLTASLNGDAHLTFTLSGPLEPRQPDPLTTGTQDDFATRQNNPPFKT